MNVRKLFLGLIIVGLISCSKTNNNSHASDVPTSNNPSASTTNSTSSSSVSTSIDNPKLLEYDPTLPNVESDNYHFLDKSYEEFPDNLVETENLTYELSEDSTYYRVSGKTSFYGSTLVIPSYHDGKPVKEIISEGFAYKSWLSEVYIPSTIEKFGAGAFSSNPRLSKIYYNAENLTDLEGRNWAFLPVADATNTIDVYIGPNVKKVPSRLFYPLSTEPDRVPNIQNIYFASNSNITEIGEYAFYKSMNAVLHDLPDTIKTIGDYAFYGIKTQNLNLPTSLTSIGDFAFAFNEELKHVKFNDSLENMGEQAFYHCSSLINADLSSTKLIVIPESCFRQNSSLKKVLFPSALETIERRAFEKCAVETVDLPESVLEIKENAFIDCLELKAIKLNSKLSLIENGAFANAINVTKLVVYSSSLNDFAQGNNIFNSLGQNQKGVEVIFMPSVKYISARFFFPSSNEDLDPNIARIVLLKNIEEIGDYAFFELDIPRLDYEGSKADFDKIDMHNNTFSNVEYYNN